MTTPNNWQPDQPGNEAGGTPEQWGYGGQPDGGYSTPDTSPYGQSAGGQGEAGYGSPESSPYGSPESSPYGGQYGEQGRPYAAGYDQTQQYGQGPEAPTAAYGEAGGYSAPQAPGYEAPAYGGGYEAPAYGGGYDAPAYAAADAGGATPPVPPKKGGMPIWGWALTAIAAVAVIGVALSFILPAVFHGGQAGTQTPTTSSTSGTGTTSSSSPAATSTSASSASSTPSATAAATTAANGTYVDLSQRTTPASVAMGFNGSGNGYGSASSSTIDGGKVDKYKSNDGKCTAAVWTFNDPAGFSQTDGQMTDQRFELDTEQGASGLEAPTNMDLVASDGTTYQMKQYKIVYDDDKAEEYAFSRTFSGLGTEVIFSLTCNAGTLTQDRIDTARGLVTLDVQR